VSTRISRTNCSSVQPTALMRTLNVHCSAVAGAAAARHRTAVDRAVAKSLSRIQCSTEEAGQSPKVTRINRSSPQPPVLMKTSDAHCWAPTGAAAAAPAPAAAHRRRAVDRQRTTANNIKYSSLSHQCA
jgi:hypothetical protein